MSAKKSPWVWISNYKIKSNEFFILYLHIYKKILKYHMYINKWILDEFQIVKLKAKNSFW